MKYFKFFLVMIIFIFIFIYVRINILYVINKDKYVETFSIQGYADGYVPQGITYSSKYDVILQTSYHDDGNGSMLYVIDFKTGNLIKSLMLKNSDGNIHNGHVGGIATNDEVIWITSDYMVSEYDLDEVINSDGNSIRSIKNNKLDYRGDFCAYHDNILWIGEFFLWPFYKVRDDKPLLRGYKIGDNINFLKADYSILLPKMVQGLVIDDSNHFIFTKSYSGVINSSLVSYDSKDYSVKRFSNNNLIDKDLLPPMAEGLFVKDEDLYILFESGSDSYFYAYPKVKKIIKIKKDF